MPASFTTSAPFNYDQLVAGETISRSGIMTSGAGVVKRGTIVGLSTTTGKYTKTDPATGILAEDCDATSADASCVVYVQGKFSIEGVIWPAAGAHSTHTALLHDTGVYILSTLADTGMMKKPDSSTVGFSEPGPTNMPIPPGGTPVAEVTVQPTSIDVGNLTAGGSILVTSPSTIPWRATTDDPWIAVTPDEITGDGSVTYTIASNDGGDKRSGTITIGDQAIRVSQSA